jgi:hypothetical protein
MSTIFKAPRSESGKVDHDPPYNTASSILNCRAIPARRASEWILFISHNLLIQG